MIFDDASATDNCGEVTIDEDIQYVGLATGCAGNYTVVRTLTATDACGNSTSATQTITVQDTTAPEFTNVPADYTSECSDDLILDDATATDNCGEVTIEVSSETIAGDAPATTRLYARSRRRMIAGTARLPLRQSRWRTPQLPS